MPPKNKYTDPKLRQEVKEEIQQSDKGGAPGQWSARKAQMMAKEYKARGGDYTTPKEDKDESQKHLSKWTEEEWQTKEGSAHAKQDDGTRKRYLPKKAWEEMTEQEKEETETKKQKGSKEGHQFVQNTPRAKTARKNAHEVEDHKYDNKEEEQKYEKKAQEQKEKTKRNTRSSAKKEDAKSEKQEQAKSNGTKEPRKGSKGSRSKNTKSEGQSGKTTGTKDDEKEEEQPGQKRSRTKSNNVEEEEEKDTKKKQKSNSGAAKSNPNSTTTTGSASKHDKTGKQDKQDKADTPGTPGSSSRLPTKGQTAHWKSTPGWIDGTVVEVLKLAREVDGKHVKASKDDPRIVLKSNKSGKVAVHKVESVYFWPD